MAKPSKPAPKKTANVVMSAPNRDHTHHSVSVSKISNGFLVTKSVDGPSGYKTVQTYSPTKPKVEMKMTAAPVVKRK